MWCPSGSDDGMEGLQWRGDGYHVSDHSVAATTGLTICRHGFNDTLDGGKAFPDGKNIEKHWLGYAQDAFGVESEDQGDESEAKDWPSRKKAQKCQKWPAITLPMLDDDTAQLPNIIDMRAQEKKDLMRTFLTHHYCK